ncbi:MAG: hypothetical protein JST89_13460 [Cyanobacteria bacterium SZAS-4]|nr:hypothetical protein [Cyanobacteria bacterium SZAS-4]
MNGSFSRYPYAFYIALDGNGLNGLEGFAGICLFLYNPETNNIAYKVNYFSGVAGGHAVMLNPSGTVGFLGNCSQHILLFDGATLEEMQRLSTLSIDSDVPCIQASTHATWLSDTEFISAVGSHFYKFNIDKLSRPEKIAEHLVKLPHAIKLSKSGRFLCYGSMDSPRGGYAKHVGVMDMVTGQTSTIALPTTCWHVATHPEEDRFYSISFRTAPTNHSSDYKDWAISYDKQYVFEIDNATSQISRHWSGSRELPLHINSDITISETELIFCNGGSQTIAFLELANFQAIRLIDERPAPAELFSKKREIYTQVYDSFARASQISDFHHILNALKINRFTCLDSVYGCQLSHDQKFLFTANRGLNQIKIYSYDDLKTELIVEMPAIQEFLPLIPEHADPRLGFHHACMR